MSDPKKIANIIAQPTVGGDHLAALEKLSTTTETSPQGCSAGQVVMTLENPGNPRNVPGNG